MPKPATTPWLTAAVRDERGIAAAESGRVEDRRVDAFVVCLVDLVDDFALDIRVKNFDLKTKLGGKAADAIVVFGKQHRAENFELDLAAHVHAGTVNDKNLG